MLDAANAALPTPSAFAWVVLPLGAYLLGSFPSAHLLARSRGIDLGTVGSRNYGATNLGRVLGRPLGFLCFGLDAAKGAIPVLVGGWILGALGADPGETSTTVAWCWIAIAAAAIVGHTLSPWIRFKGGKGVATGFGALVAMWPVLTLPAATALVLWGVVVLLTRLVALASMVAAASVPCSVAIAALAGGGVEGLRLSVPYLVATGAIALFVTWKHRANIARMRAGAEDRVGDAKTPEERLPPGNAPDATNHATPGSDSETSPEPRSDTTNDA